MLKEIYTAALGMLPQQTALEVTANNLANASTTGFKKEGVFQRELIEARQNLLNTVGTADQNDTPQARFGNFSQGAIQKTENPLDVAIDGAGYFVIQDEFGNESLTRAGNFVMNENGVLATKDGKTVMGEDGEIFIRKNQLDPLNNVDERPLEIRIDKTGEVFVNNQYVDRLQVVQVVNEQSLERMSGTQFRPTDETEFEILDQDTTSVKQFHIEGSNVNIVEEMVKMIALQRSFELGQKVIQTNDATLDKSIELGRFS